MQILVAGSSYANNAPNFNNCTHVIMVHKIQVMVAFFYRASNSYVPGETYTIGVTVTEQMKGIWFSGSSPIRK